MTKEEKLKLYEERVELKRDFASITKGAYANSNFINPYNSKIYKKIIADYCNKRIEEIDKLLEL